MKIKKVNEMNSDFSDYSQNFIDWLNTRSDKSEVLDTLQLEGKEISPNVYDFYGDEISGVKIDVEELLGFGTQAGRVENTCFDQVAIDYLKDCGVNYIISTIFLNEPIKLGHCLIPFKTKQDGNKFSKMIDKRNGSLTNQGKFKEYFFFETE